MASAHIPRIGLGTWQNRDPKQCAESVREAIELGYRHVDTAQMYGNEQYVGEGLKQSSVGREEIILATKVWIDNLGYEKLKRSTLQSLEKLGTDYVDILYIHWPAGSYSAKKTLQAMNELADEGKVRHIAVSNFTPRLLDEAIELSKRPIIANQVEMHPMNQQTEMVEYLRKKKLTLVAYSPLARGRVMHLPEMTEIAGRYSVSEAQVSLAWLLSHENVVAIPKGTSEEHLRENLEAMSLKLNREDIERIDAINVQHRVVDPSFAPDW